MFDAAIRCVTGSKKPVTQRMAREKRLVPEAKTLQQMKAMLQE
ncbi:hypothetical protein [Legionella feeleii]|nr:hypothetical protein [Legionella feeleii]